MKHFEYIKWYIGHDKDLPVFIIYEIDLDNERYATRMANIFADGTVIPVIEEGFDFITETPVPTIDEINQEKDYYAEIISKEEFEEVYFSETYSGSINSRSNAMTTFNDNYTAFLSDFGKGRKMVLSTAENNRVSSRMMSVVQVDGVFYFQTDLTFNKYRQISGNPNVALCVDNIQIEGICEEIGHPLQNEAFCKVFQECFKGSYDAYTSLKNERLFAVNPTFIERWVYRDGVPYIETFDISTHEHKLIKYSGV